ncbi:hypothetical protein [Dactylosporangium sp. NPDC051541]|uniref:hypothetical protein n=1 Tax=Dactylosporangium sp. NPDC051541 TaxID=3363977 RepID=UPI00379D5EDC
MTSERTSVGASSPAPDDDDRPPVVVPYGTTTTRLATAGHRIRLPHLPPAAVPPLTRAADRHESVPRPGRRRTVQAVAAVVTLAVAVGGWLVVRASTGPGPVEVVRELYDSLAAHDISRWSTFDRCNNNPICGTGALSHGYQAPQQVTFKQDRADGGKGAVVTATYDLGGQHITDRVVLEYSRTGLFGGSWWIRTVPTTTLTIAGPSPAPVNIAGITLQPKQLTATLTFTAPPGLYTISRAATPLIAPAETTAVAGPGQAAAVTLPAEPVTTIAEDTDRLIRDRIDECVAQHRFQPDVDPRSPLHSCPFDYYPKQIITDTPTWTVQQYPRVTLTPTGDGNIKVTTTTPGTITLHYRWTMFYQDPRDWTDVDVTQPLKANGQIASIDGVLQWYL